MIDKKIKTISLIAPCGRIKNVDELNNKIKILEKKFKVKKFYDPNFQHSYFSDVDENRCFFLEQAFLDCETDLVLNVRGGFGAIRIVDMINYDLIKSADKFYCASSDASILLASLSKKTNIKCFHGSMLTNGFAENLDENIKIIENDIFNIKLERLNNFKRPKNFPKGYLWGGNLSSIVSMFSGKLYLPKGDIILFLEDLNEPLYKIDKMLFEIYRNKKLKEKIQGIIFGDFCLRKKETNPLLIEYAKKFDVDCFVTNEISHRIENKTIPYGKLIEL